MKTTAMPELPPGHQNHFSLAENCPKSKGVFQKSLAEPKYSWSGIQTHLELQPRKAQVVSQSPLSSPHFQGTENTHRKTQRMGGEGSCPTPFASLCPCTQSSSCIHWGASALQHLFGGSAPAGGSSPAAQGTATARGPLSWDRCALSISGGLRAGDKRAAWHESCQLPGIWHSSSDREMAVLQMSLARG